MKATSKSVVKRLAAQKGKPIVQYDELMLLRVGAPAMINRTYGHNHGNVKGDGYVQTSRVIGYHGLGCFETLNTFYTPRNPRDFDRTREMVDAKVS